MLGEISNTLFFHDNRDLVEITGFQNLLTIGAKLQIEGSRNLHNIEGFSRLQIIGSNLYISETTSLSHLDPLENLLYVGENVDISGNLSLSDCLGILRLLDEVDDAEPGPGPGIAGVPDVGAQVTLEDNLRGCNSIDGIDTILRDSFETH